MLHFFDPTLNDYIFALRLIYVTYTIPYDIISF